MRRRKFLPWWKERYREDIGRGRHRRYPLENIFAVDLSSMQAFRALRAKLARDYLIFFRNLEKAYPTGELGEETKAASKLVVSTLRLVDRSIASGVPQKEDVEDIIANVDVLNAQRDFFVRRAEESQPLKEEIEKTEEETGISPESLNITKEMIRRGVRIEKRRARRRAVPFARRMPRTFGLGAELGKGLGVAALGPFYPIAEMLGGPLREIFGLGRGMLRRREERGLEKLLRPTALGYPGEGLRRGAGFGALGVSTPGVPGISGGSVFGAFRLFFDKEAYRTKWTKELLQRIKELGRPRERKEGLVGGIAERLGLPAVGAALGALLPAIAGAAAGAIPVWLIEKAYAKYTESVAKAYESLEGLVDATSMWTKYAAEMRTQLVKDIKESMKFAGPLMGEIQAREKGELQVPLENLRRDPFATPGLEEVKRIQRGAPEIMVPLEKMEKVGLRGLTRAGAGAWGPALFPQHSTLGASSGMDKQIEKLLKAMDNLSNQMGPRRTQSSIKEPGLGDPFDSADALLSEYTSGRLTLEER